MQQTEAKRHIITKIPSLAFLPHMSNVCSLHLTWAEWLSCKSKSIFLPTLNCPRFLQHSVSVCPRVSQCLTLTPFLHVINSHDHTYFPLCPQDSLLRASCFIAALDKDKQWILMKASIRCSLCSVHSTVAVHSWSKSRLLDMLTREEKIKHTQDVCLSWSGNPFNTVMYSVVSVFWFM